MLSKTDTGVELRRQLSTEEWATLRLSVWDIVIEHLERDDASTDGRQGLQQLLYFLRPCLEDEIELAVAP